MSKNINYLKLLDSVKNFEAYEDDFKLKYKSFLENRMKNIINSDYLLEILWWKMEKWEKIGIPSLYIKSNNQKKWTISLMIISIFSYLFFFILPIFIIPNLIYSLLFERDFEHIILVIGIPLMIFGYIGMIKEVSTIEYPENFKSFFNKKYFFSLLFPIYKLNIDKWKTHYLVGRNGLVIFQDQPRCIDRIIYYKDYSDENDLVKKNQILNNLNYRYRNKILKIIKKNYSS